MSFDFTDWQVLYKGGTLGDSNYPRSSFFSFDPVPSTFQGPSRPSLKGITTYDWLVCGKTGEIMNQTVDLVSNQLKRDSVL